MFRGLDSAAHLYDWLTERGQQYLAICIADVLQLPQEQQLSYLRLLDQWFERTECIIEAAADGLKLRAAIQSSGHRGYALLPVAPMATMELDLLEEIQGWLHVYIESRRSRGKPTFRTPCSKGVGHRDKRCNECAGTGYVLVLGEITPVEQALSEGKSWDSIDKEGIQ
jgi:hypothetical protein